TKEYIESIRFIYQQQNFCDDVYGMGKVITELFPELHRDAICIRKKSNMSSIEFAIMILVSSMTHTNRIKRCTIKNALDYCQFLSGKINEVDKATVIEARDNFLKNKVTVEDVLKGRLK